MQSSTAATSLLRLRSNFDKTSVLINGHSCVCHDGSYSRVKESAIQSFLIESRVKKTYQNQRERTCLYALNQHELSE